jgi:hypothetical protein
MIGTPPPSAGSAGVLKSNSTDSLGSYANATPKIVVHQSSNDLNDLLSTTDSNSQDPLMSSLKHSGRKRSTSSISCSLDKFKLSTEKLSRKRSGTATSPLTQNIPGAQGNGSSGSIIASVVEEETTIKPAKEHKEGKRISDFFRSKQKSVPITKSSIKSRACLLEGIMHCSSDRKRSATELPVPMSPDETCECLVHYDILQDSIFDSSLDGVQEYLFGADAEVFKEALSKFGYKGLKYLVVLIMHRNRI